MFSTIPSLIARSFPGGGGGYDPDAQTYINAVLAAGGTLSTPQQDAINTYFLDLKSDGIFSKLYFNYLYLGGVANSNKINAVNPGTYDLNFQGTWTHSTSGSAAIRNDNTYADTGYDAGAGYSTVNSDWSFGAIMKDRLSIFAGYSGVSSPYMIIGVDNTKWDNYFPNNQAIVNSNPTDFWLSLSRTNNDWYSVYKVGGTSASSGLTFASTITDSYTKPTSPMNIYINKINGVGLAMGATYLMTWGGQKLTNTESNNFLLRINTLLTTFSTQIFT